ncbi:MAG TPA: hypothetical protein VI197_32525 [Polyangiaceae bacterium]
MSDAPHPETALLQRARTRWLQRFGIASRSVLEAALARGLGERVGARTAAQFAADLERKHIEQYGAARLRAEFADDAERALARSDAAALARYVEQWTRKIAYRQRAHAARWWVAGLSSEEVRDALSLRLWEVTAAGSEAELAYCRVGREWGLQVLLSELRSLRRRFGVFATSTDFWATPLPERAPNQEERWIELEAESCRARARGRALSRLTPALETWLGTFEAAARCGDFFQSSHSLNLSAASRALGKNRSSALRAYRQLEHEFQRELERFE